MRSQLLSDNRISVNAVQRVRLLWREMLEADAPFISAQLLIDDEWVIVPGPAQIEEHDNGLSVVISYEPKNKRIQHIRDARLIVDLGATALRAGTIETNTGILPERIRKGDTFNVMFTVTI